MAVKHLPEMQDFHTYPMITLCGIQELMYYKGKYYNQQGVDVSDEVEYTWVYTRFSRGTI